MSAVIARDTHLIIDSKSAMLVGFQPVDAAVEQLRKQEKVSDTPHSEQLDELL